MALWKWTETPEKYLDSMEILFMRDPEVQNSEIYNEKNESGPIRSLKGKTWN